MRLPPRTGRSRRRLPGLGGWDEDPLWATAYDWLVEHPAVGVPAWRLGLGSDLRRLYAAAGEISTLPEGSRVLDVPAGGGVALRGLHAGQGLDYVAADIAQPMLDRTMRAARQRGVADQVTPCLADVGALPFGAGSFDLVVSFTGLHCFPDPRRAVDEMARVLRPGGAITGSSMFLGAGWRLELARRTGTAAGILGPMCTAEEALGWLRTGCHDVHLEMSGGIGYFRALRD